MEQNSEIKSDFIAKTFFWMFLGLLGTAIMAWYTYSSGLLINILEGGSFRGLLLLELVVVILFSFLFKKLPPMIVGILYFIYAMINGISVSTIFAIYELNSIVYLFLASAAVFGALAFTGYKTKKDVSSASTILFTILIIGLVLSVINLFIGNSMLDLILDWVILFTFGGITIYDMNTIKNMQYWTDEGNQERLYIYGAMQLYLDFINIFLRIISIFGKRKN